MVAELCGVISSKNLTVFSLSHAYTEQSTGSTSQSKVEYSSFLSSEFLLVQRLVWHPLNPLFSPAFPVLVPLSLPSRVDN
jgi:hypothetical protein